MLYAKGYEPHATRLLAKLLHAICRLLLDNAIQSFYLRVVMHRFSTIFEDALVRKGSIAELESSLPKPAPDDVIAKITDDRWLAAMTKGVFQAGFVWRVIENKWADFEVVFEGFSPLRWANSSPDDFERLLKDARIVRNAQKIQTVPKNAQFICDVASEHGSFGQFIASWPSDDLNSLYALLQKQGARLGGSTAAYMLRTMGKDTYLLTDSVCAALVAHGVVDKKPTGKGARQKVQDAFNTWHAESGRSYGEMSLILAYSVPD